MAGRLAVPCYRMPAEWEPHAATWVAWPHNRTDWPGKFQPIPWVFAEIVRHISCGERVNIAVQDRLEEAAARKVLAHAHVSPENVRFHCWKTDRIWTRDSGAIFARDGRDRVVALHWAFNAWAKYDDWHNDAKLPQHMARHLKLECVQPCTRSRDRNRRLVLEGGSIDVNGQGTMLTTKECLLSPEVQVRNPGLGRQELEEVFRQYLGVHKVIWLPRGIAGDDTHGHIDDIARFVAPNTVVAAVEPDPKDPNHEPLRENLKLLRRATGHDGHRLRVIELPMPAPVVFRGQRLPASYANFYVANAAVLVPVFDDPNDRLALNVLARLFPTRRVIGIGCRDFVLGLGTIHCMTQQEPVVGR